MLLGVSMELVYAG